MLIAIILMQHHSSRHIGLYSDRPWLSLCADMVCVKPFEARRLEKASFVHDCAAEGVEYGHVFVDFLEF